MVVRNPRMGVGTSVAALLLLGAAFAPWIAGISPQKVDFSASLQSPSLHHIAGTDLTGRDLFSRTVFGSRIAFAVGAFTLLITTTIGLLFGTIAGYTGGRTDQAIMRVADAMLAFPPLILMVVIAGAIGPGITNVIIAIGLTFSPITARVVRAEVIRTKALPFVESARTVGAGDICIALRHIIPNAVSPLIVLASSQTAAAILAEAGVSYLGLGVRPPTPSWGAMMFDGQRYFLQSPWVLLVPGLAASIAILGLNLLGDGLRDALDPRMRTR